LKTLVCEPITGYHLDQMIYDALLKLVQKHIYIVFKERYKNEHSHTYIERYVAKHPLLKPEVIVINDQPHGFKKVADSVSSLEKFPIYLEIEYTLGEDDEKYIDNVDLYAEAKIKIAEKETDVLYLSKVYSKTISLESVKRINDPTYEALFIYSKIGQLFSEDYLEQDVEDGLIAESELGLMFEVNIVSFLNFLKTLDDVLVKGKHLNKIDQIFKPK
jgi:hypothetical protein